MSHEVTLSVEGMTCQHCVRSLTEEVSALAGVEALSVDLVAEGSSTLSVTCVEGLGPEAIAKAVVAAGYTPTGTK